MFDNRNDHFVIRHDLASLVALPNLIWNTERGPDTTPKGYNQIAKGSKWVAYAYTSNDSNQDRLRHITGFYTCVRPYQFGPIPLSRSELRGLDLAEGASAWLIEGKPDRMKLPNPVLVPSIDYFFDTKKFGRQAITRISQDEYERIRSYVLQHQISPAEIPVFGREPKNEQEVLAIFVKVHEALGVKRILRVRQKFPDVKVELEGALEPLKIELELYGQNYISHGHRKDRKVAMLCWLDDDPRGDGKKVRDRVGKVFELRDLLKNKQKIVWQERADDE